MISIGENHIQHENREPKKKKHMENTNKLCKINNHKKINLRVAVLSLRKVLFLIFWLFLYSGTRLTRSMGLVRLPLVATSSSHCSLTWPGRLEIQLKNIYSLTANSSRNPKKNFIVNIIIDSHSSTTWESTHHGHLTWEDNIDTTQYEYWDLLICALLFLYLFSLINNYMCQHL